jgi:lysophospholipase L1-like esterase
MPKDKESIVFLGDSLTSNCEWSELFSDVRVKNRGISGDTTDGLFQRLNQIIALKPKKVFIMIGVNDLLKGQSTDAIISNYLKILNSLSGNLSDTKIYVQSYLPVASQDTQQNTALNKEIIKLNKQLKSMVTKINKPGIQYVDLHKGFVGTGTEQLNPKYTVDGLHLSGDGYLLWESLIRVYIK